MAYSRNFDSESTGAAGNIADGSKSASTLWTIDDTVFYGGSGKSLKISNNSVNVGQNWQYDTSQDLSSGDFTLNFKAQVHTLGSGSTQRIGWAFRINPAHNACYAVLLRPTAGASTFRLSRFSGGSETTIVTATLGSLILADTWYKVKITTLGTSIKAKMWLSTDSEPVAWDIDTTDATLDNTNVGTGPYFFDGDVALGYGYIDDVSEETSSQPNVVSKQSCGLNILNGLLRLNI